MTIDDLKIGQSGTIDQVGGEGALRLRFLDMGLIPGTKVKDFMHHFIFFHHLSIPPAVF